MNLRNVSIGLSSIILLGIVGAFAYLSFPIRIGDIGDIVFCSLFCIFPPIVSIVVSLYTKRPISQILSASVSLLYGYCFASYIVFLTHGQGNVLALFFIGILLLPVMFPIWITALVLNRYYTKQSKPQS